MKTGSNQCEIGPLLGAYHDGELPSGQRAEVEAHVRDCAACTAELSDMQRFTLVFRSASRPAAPSPEKIIADVEALMAEPVGKITPETADRPVAVRPSPFVRHARWITAVAAVVCVVATGRLIWLGSDGGKPGTGPGVTPVTDTPVKTTQPAEHTVPLQPR